MLLTADAWVSLPFALDYCAAGPDVAPLVCTLDGWHVTLLFPPSLSDDTDGQGIFGEWAWWTGSRLRLILERDAPSVEDASALHTEACRAASQVLRRFLNAYRVRFQRSAVHPVKVDPRRLTLTFLHDDGRREALPEPVASFFYQTLPKEPPLAQSVNATTLRALQEDVQSGAEPALAAQLALDADALDAQGEPARAAWLRERIE